MNHENLAFNELESELDSVIGQIAEAAATPLVKPADTPVPTPFKAGFVRDVADMAFGKRPLSDAERKPIPPQNPARPAQAPQSAQPVAVSGSEAERFLATGERLLDVQRKKIQELESRYEVDRIKLIDAYRIKLRDLEHEASEALRSFDIKHQGEKADARRILDALVAMRG